MSIIADSAMLAKAVHQRNDFAIGMNKDKEDLYKIQQLIGDINSQANPNLRGGRLA